MIEWIATCDTGGSSMTMWSALMGVKRKKDLNIPKDASSADWSHLVLVVNEWLLLQDCSSPS